MSVSSKILVKVGKTSKVKFRGIQAFRAITLDELERLSNLNPDASIAIIENIKQSDEQKIKEFIKRFESISTSHKVFFLVMDNDDVTCGIADELAYDIYLNLKDLYRAIKLNCGITVDTDLSLSAEVNSTFDEGFDTSFDDVLDTVSSNMNKDIELPTIETKDDLSEFDTSFIEDEIAEEKETVTETATKIPDAIKQDHSGVIDEAQVKKLNELKSKLIDHEEEIGLLKGQLKEAISKTKTLGELTLALETEKLTYQNRLKLYNENKVLEEPISLIEYQELKNKVEQLSQQSDTNNETAVQLIEAHADLAEANEKIKSLELDIAEIKNQLDTYNSEKEAEETKIAELSDTITQLNTEIADKEKEIIGLKSGEIESDSIKKQLDSINESTAELEKLLEQAKSEVARLTEESDALYQSKVSEATSRLYITELLSTSISEIYNLTLKIHTAEEERNSLNATIVSLETAVETHKATVSELRTTIDGFGTVNETLEKLKSSKAELERLNTSQSETISELNLTITKNREKIAAFEIELAQVDKRVELAHKFSKEEVDKAKVELEEVKKKYVDVKTKYELKSNQLEASEVKLKEALSSDALSLQQNNVALEEINSSLRRQVDSLKRDVDAAINDKVVTEKLMETMKESMKSMYSGAKEGSSVGSLQSFKYQGKARIIPVFGCGSYGITTTAMSIATKLSTQGKVLYIDFDMVSPKADSWFKINPIIKGLPGVDSSGTKASGLSLLVDYQMKFFSDNSMSIILKAVQTKSGCIDYISGFYSKPDIVKLMSTDYGAFLNFCGNLYEYIIVDFGRLGSSDTNDQIIKAFSDVSYRSVIVTTSDKFEIRTFRMKMAESKLDINNVAWLINMCERTNIEEIAKKAISPAQYSMMMFSMGLYGKRLDFTKEQITRDKLSLFMEQILFRT